MSPALKQVAQAELGLHLAWLRARQLAADAEVRYQELQREANVAHKAWFDAVEKLTEVATEEVKREVGANT